MSDRTNKQIVADCNELARMFYKSFGYDVRKGYRFDRASHPQEAGVWRQAVMAYDFIEGTEVDDVLRQMEESK